MLHNFKFQHEVKSYRNHLTTLENKKLPINTRQLYIDNIYRVRQPTIRVRRNGAHFMPLSVFVYLVMRVSTGQVHQLLAGLSGR